MASVNFMKLKSAGEVKAMLRHCDKEERIKHEHSNKDIDKTVTSRNIDVGGGYEKSCKRYDARIRRLDESTNTNKRSDRVTAFGLTVPAPYGMDEECSARFFKEAYKIIMNQYGKENVIAGYIHFDEQHAYMENGEVKQSRPHFHLYMVPEHDGKLNGKWFSSRANMKKLNNEIDKMCKERFGVKFMTGEPARKMSVESLKRLGNEELGERERLVEALQAAYAENDGLKEQNEHLRKSCYAISEWAISRNEVQLMDYIDRALKQDRAIGEKGAQKLKQVNIEEER